ncbi:ribosomal protein S9, partial [Ostertagia ostertagi]
MEKQKNAVGRRKEAVARVYLSKGTGNITVNGKEYKNYFPLMYLQNQVELPLKTIEVTEAFDLVINVQGGGPKGQAEAIKMGIARVLCEVNPEYRPALKKEGLMTRDS